jgi:hypothetical protein
VVIDVPDDECVVKATRRAMWSLIMFPMMNVWFIQSRKPVPWDVEALDWTRRERWLPPLQPGTFVMAEVNQEAIDGVVLLSGKRSSMGCDSFPGKMEHAVLPW